MATSSGSVEELIAHHHLRALDVRGRLKTMVRGFSFAELMCGVVILLLLTGITITWYQDSISEAKLTLAKVETVGMAEAISGYQMRTRTPYISSAPPPDYKSSGADPWGQPYRVDPASRTVSS